MVEINVPILHIKNNEKPQPLIKREGRRLMSRVEDLESVQTGSKEGGRSRGQSNLSIDINNKDNQEIRYIEQQAVSQPVDSPTKTFTYRLDYLASDYFGESNV